jgi:anti-sigma factor RsiW
MTCRLVEHHGGAWVDGELDASASLELERHVSVCDRCREQIELERSLRTMLRSADPEVCAPSGFRERAFAALASEPPLPSRGIVFRSWVPQRPALAAAAGVARVLAISRAVVAPDERPVSHAGIAPVFEDIVRLDANPGHPDVGASEDVAPQQVPRYFRGRVGFPVRPAAFDEPNLRLVGARVSNIGNRRAAALYYAAPNRRLTVVVFDAYDVAPWSLRFRPRGGREIYYRQVGGFTVPVFRERGVSYALTGDFDAPSLLRLAAGAQVVEGPDVMGSAAGGSGHPLR